MRVTWRARPLQAFNDAPIAELAGHHDLVVLDHPHIGTAASSGALVPLDGALDAAFLAEQAAGSVGPSHHSYEWDGHQWALAIDAAAEVSAYRPDLLAQLEMAPPKTWGDALALARRARLRGQFVALPLIPADTLAHFLTMCANAGHPPCEAREVVVARAVGREQLRLLRRLADLSHPQSPEWDPIGLLERMSRSDEVVYCPLLFGYSNYSRSGFRPKLVRFLPVPSAGRGPIGGLLGGAGLAVSATSRELQAALEYAAFVAAPETQRTLYFDHGGQPGHRSAWTDPAVNLASNDFFLDTLPGTDAAYLRRRDPVAIEFHVHGGTVLVRWLRGDATEDEALDELDAVWRATALTVAAS